MHKLHLNLLLALFATACLCTQPGPSINPHDAKADQTGPNPTPILSDLRPISSSPVLSIARPASIPTASTVSEGVSNRRRRCVSHPPRIQKRPES